MLSGPVPLVVVCNVTAVPRHARTLLRGVSAGGVRTASAAWLVIVPPHTPLTRIM